MWKGECLHVSTSRDLTIKEVTDEYLDSINVKCPPNPADIAGDILANTRVAFDIHNAVASKDTQWRIQNRLLPIQIADIMVKLYPIAMIHSRKHSSFYPVLGVYQEDGEDKGIYVTDKYKIWRIAAEFCYGLTKWERSEIFANLEETAPKIWLCEESYLVAMNNGIYDKDADRLMPFTPDLVFLKKSDEDYNPNSDEMLCE